MGRGCAPGLSQRVHLGGATARGLPCAPARRPSYLEFVMRSLPPSWACQQLSLLPENRCRWDPGFNVPAQDRALSLPFPDSSFQWVGFPSIMNLPFVLFALLSFLLGIQLSAPVCGSPREGFRDRAQSSSGWCGHLRSLVLSSTAGVSSQGLSDPVSGHEMGSCPSARHRPSLMEAGVVGMSVWPQLPEVPTVDPTVPRAGASFPGATFCLLVGGQVTMHGGQGGLQGLYPRG